jgi:hypothetical protein
VRRNLIVAFGSVALLASFAAAQPSAAGPRPGRASAACASLERVATSSRLLCTHGGDPVFPFLTEASRLPARSFRRLAAPCASGNDVIRVFYGYPKDTVPRFKAERSLILQAVRQDDANLAASGAKGYHYRWFCAGTKPKLKITKVRLVAIGTDAAFTYNDYVNSMQNQVSLRLGKVDYDLGTVDYATFVDNIQAVYPYGGQGSIYGDDRADPGVNLNNASSGVHKYAMINFVPAWGVGSLALILGHETGHNLGNVQLSAPHSSGAYLCYDEYDLMCYDDGGSYFQNGGSLQYLCGDPLGTGAESDCGHDDYFNASPPGGSYLATHWNEARSSWITH